MSSCLRNRYPTPAALLALFSTLASPPAPAAVIAADDFEHFTGAGLAPGGGDGTLDSFEWSVGGASDGASPFGARRTGGDFARGETAQAVKTGGLYAFASPGGLRALGVQATGSDFTPGTLIRRVANPFAEALSDLALIYASWVRNDAARATAVSVDVALASAPATWIPVPALGFVSARLPGPGLFETLLHAAPLPIAVLAPGDALLLRWTLDDAGGSGARDEIGLTALRVTAQRRQVAELASPPGAVLALSAVVLGARAGRRRLRTGNGPASRG